MAVEIGTAVSQQKLDNIKGRLLGLKEHLDVSNLRFRIEELEQQTLAPGFWEKTDVAQEVQKELGQLQDTVNGFDARWKEYEDTDLFLEMVIEEKDVELEQEIADKIEEIEESLALAELECMFSGEHDRSNAIIEIHAGAGGTEAQDWTDILLRMYLRWGERHGCKTSILDYQAGDEAGVKSVSVMFTGRFAYGYLRSEIGIHRLVRISPFDSSGRRHTSFASVMVMPELDDSINVEIDDKDLRVDTYRSSGAGGQHVNKTSSAIRLTHIPTGIVVQCQNERSQHHNKDTAMKMLASRLYEVERQKQAAEHESLAGDKMGISWGSQIRSYVMQPYRMIKDLRTNYETGNIDAVLDGNLDAFIKAYLMMSMKR
nr:peptide chain release factor 2 [Desulforhopalus vacuolatus]